MLVLAGFIAIPVSLFAQNTQAPPVNFRPGSQSQQLAKQRFLQQQRNQTTTRPKVVQKQELVSNKKPKLQSVLQTVKRTSYTRPRQEQPQEQFEYRAPPRPLDEATLPAVNQPATLTPPQRVARNPYPAPKRSQGQLPVPELRNQNPPVSGNYPPARSSQTLSINQENNQPRRQPQRISRLPRSPQESVLDSAPIHDPFSDKNPRFQPSRHRLQEQPQPRLKQSGENVLQNQDKQNQDGTQLNELSCQEFRDQLMSETIQNIDLNISPHGPHKNGVPTAVMGAERSWMDRHGNVLATGSMVKLRHGYVHINSNGGTLRIPIARLSDADLVEVGRVWKIPETCTLGSNPYPHRSWCPQTFTWKASALCHKPLYFEDIQLERYGHSAGPIRQPIRSAAHFFASYVFWPYQTAIHPQQECQYALGYYRPGNCAPWLVDPIPISGRGIIRQSLYSVGGAYLFWP